MQECHVNKKKGTNPGSKPLSENETIFQNSFGILAVRRSKHFLQNNLRTFQTNVCKWNVFYVSNNEEGLLNC